MKSDIEIRLAAILRNTARYFLLLIWTIVGLYLVLENYNGSISDIIDVFAQSPFTLLWFILLGLILIAWIWKFFGGTTIILFGIAMFYYFNFRAINFLSTESILAIVIIFLGLLILLSWYILLERD